MEETVDLSSDRLLTMIFEKYSHGQFRENLSSGSRVVQCVHMDGVTDMMKLIVAFCKFVNGPKLGPLTEWYRVGEVCVKSRRNVMEAGDRDVIGGTVPGSVWRD